MNIIFISNQVIRKGIIKIKDELSNPIIFDANAQNFNVISSGELFVIDKETNEIKYQNDSEIFDPPYLLYMDKTKNYFLLANGDHYKINLNEQNEVISLSRNTSLEIDFYYIGYIIQKDSSDNDEEIDDVIVYGKNGREIYLYYIYENRPYTINYVSQENIEDKYLSCKLIDKDIFICSFHTYGFFRIIILICNRDTKICDEGFYLSYSSSEYSNGFLFDTLDNNVKVLCSKKGGVITIACSYITIELTDNYNIIKNEQLFDLSYDYFITSCLTENCNFIYFFSEYLLCCSCLNHIACTRFKLDFEIINYFVLSIGGRLSKVTFFKNENYISFYFINTNDIIYKKIFIHLFVKILLKE